MSLLSNGEDGVAKLVKVAICQPTYVPWLGYFDLIDQVDAFVLLDTVQFEKQSWQQRNRIKTPAGLKWLTIPVNFRGQLGQRISEVEIRSTDFVRVHIRGLELNYSRTRYFARFFPELSAILGGVKPGSKLADLNVRLLEWMIDLLGIRTPLLLASSLNELGKRTELLANICHRLGANQYLSPIGSAEYLLGDMSVMSKAGIKTLFHHYVHPRYEQRFPPFVPFASVVDLIFNEGDRSLEIIRTGRRTSLTPDQVVASMSGVKQL